MKYFIRWLVVFSLVVLGIFVLFYTGLIVKINDADVTKLSFLVLILFVTFSTRVGYCLYKNIDSDLATTRFVTDTFLKIGLIGTICGFIYMLTYTFCGIDVANISGVQKSLIEMARGMGTALYTTAAGLICNLIMKIQLFIYDQSK